MRYGFIYCLLLMLLLSSCKNDRELLKVRELIASIKEKYAPDTRVAYFDLKAEKQKKELVIKGMTISADAHKALFGHLKKQGIHALDSVEVLPSPALEGKLYGIVNVSVSNIRNEARHGAELATQALLGTPLKVWKQDKGFYLVQTPDDYFGWLDSGGFVLMDKTAYNLYLRSDRAVCTQDYIFAYQEPTENSPKVSDLLGGNILQSLEKQGAFTKVIFPDGRTGYVNSSFLSPLEAWINSRMPDAEHIISTARELMGRPYLWGGTSGKGMDCSGFTKTVFYLNGLLLPRDASQQVLAGLPVETDTTLRNLLPGDLLFFGQKESASQKERIRHVAIYLGDGKIIHASNMVALGSLKRGDPDFQADRLNSFIRGKRMIGAPPESGVVPLAKLSGYSAKELSD